MKIGDRSLIMEQNLYISTARITRCDVILKSGTCFICFVVFGTKYSVENEVFFSFLPETNIYRINVSFLFQKRNFVFHNYLKPSLPEKEVSKLLLSSTGSNGVQSVQGFRDLCQHRTAAHAL